MALLKRSSMKTSDNGIQLIKSFESCRLQSYLDMVGVPTIAYGSLGLAVFLTALILLYLGIVAVSYNLSLS